MKQPIPPPHVIRFGIYEVDLKSSKLRKSGLEIKLQEQPFQLLATLISRPGSVVTREELRRTLWPYDTFADFDHGLAKAIEKLREALGDSADNPRFVETLPRHGYRFISPVEGQERDAQRAQRLPETPGVFPLHSPARDLPGKVVSHYRIHEKLGSGGMGEVYEAEDLKLGRCVALKFLPEEFSDDPKALERFKREARTASALNHHNICTIYEVDEHEGQPFIAMELCQGRTLKQLVAEGPLESARVSTIAMQVADALDTAHSKGIIHRDLKPANIFITERGEAKVLDFGLAKLIPEMGRGAQAAGVSDRSASETGEGPLTTAGAAVGTVAYMSPEQLRGEELDSRTDLFSFGAVLYEMATGQQAFPGKTAAVVSDAILNRAPESPQRFNPELPAKLDAIIRKALEKDRTKRYATAHALRDDLAIPVEPSPVRHFRPRLGLRLRWVLASLALVLLALAVLLIPAVRQPFCHSFPWACAPPIPEKKSIAVLPFKAANGGAETQDYCQGLGVAAADTLTLLTAGRRLQVMPPKEVLTRGIVTAEAARSELGTNLVFQGSCSQSGRFVRVDYALVDAATSLQLRSRTVTREASQSFALYDELVRGMARMLQLELTPSEHEALATRGTQVPDAYTFYVRGRGFLADPHRTENVENAIKLFERARELDPNYALAFAGLGLAFWEKYELTEETSWVDTARMACERAQTLDPQLAAAHICVATVLNGTGEYEKASAAFRLALEVEPTNDEAYRGLAYSQEHLGQLEAAEQTYLEAIKLRPDYSMGYNWLGIFYYGQNRYSDAAEMWGKMIALAPDSFMGYSNMGSAYFMLGRYAEAIQMYERSAAIQATPFAVANLGTVYYYQRRFTESARTLEKALKLNDRDYFTWGQLGSAYYWARGERQKSAAALQRAVALAKEKLKVNERDTTILRHLADYSSMLGEREAALAYLQRARTLAPHDAELEFYAAMVYAQSGEVTMTLQCLQKAISWGYSRTTILNSPDFDKFRDEARFQDLMRQ